MGYDDILRDMLQKLLMPFGWIWKTFTRQRGWVKLAIVMLVVGGIGFGWYTKNKATKADQYDLAEATYGDITELVSESGNVTTAGATPLYSTTTGMVDEVLVQNGSGVKRGDKLFAVISSATEQEKETALANYLAAKTALETAQAAQLSLQAAMFGAWDSYKTLAESDEYETGEGIARDAERQVAQFQVPQKEWLAAEANYKKQTVAVKQASVAQAAAWQAYQATQDSTVTAVMDGVVENLAVTKGDRVMAPTAVTLSSTQPVLVLFDPGVKTTVKLDIGETDVVKVEPGQKAVVTVDAYPDVTFDGLVERVDTLAVPTDGVVTYGVYVAINDPTQKLKAGMTADVDITVSQRSQVLTVPSSAVKPYEGGRAVRVVGDKGNIEYVPVTIGAKGEGETEILTGLEPGTKVIVALKNEQVKRSGSLF